jgi:hypothetical protein
MASAAPIEPLEDAPSGAGNKVQRLKPALVAAGRGRTDAMH